MVKSQRKEHFMKKRDYLTLPFVKMHTPPCYKEILQAFFLHLM